MNISRPARQIFTQRSLPPPLHKGKAVVILISSILSNAVTL